MFTGDTVLNPNNLKDQIACHIFYSMSLGAFIIQASSYNLAVIAIERYLAISRPLQYHEDIVRKRLPWVLLLVWLVSVVAIALEAAFAGISPEGECILYHGKSLGYQYLANIYGIIFMTLIPVIIMVCAYASIAITLSKYQKEAATVTTSGGTTGRKDLSQVQRDVIITAVILSVCFLLVWCFVWIVQVAAMFFGVDPYPYYHFSLMSVSLNAAVNPYVYCLRYTEFRQRLRAMIGCRSRSKNASEKAMTEN